MNFQAPALRLLDDIFHAAADAMSAQNPDLIRTAYLKILLEPLAPEARVWINSSFDHFGHYPFYEVFRPLDDAAEADLSLRKRYYLRASSALNALMESKNRHGSVSAVFAEASSKRLDIVFQQPRSLIGFLNVYIAIASANQDANNAVLEQADAAARHYFECYNSYYYALDPNCTPFSAESHRN